MSPSSDRAGGLLDDDLVVGPGLDGRLLVQHRRTGRSALLSPEAGRLLRFTRHHDDLPSAGAAVAVRLGCDRERAERALHELHDRLADAGLVRDRAERQEGRRRLRASRWLATVPMRRVLRLRLAAPDAPGRPRKLDGGGVYALLALVPVLAGLVPLVLARVAHHTPDATAILVARAAVVRQDPTPDLSLVAPVLGVLGVALLANAVHEASHALACRVVGVAVQEAGVALWWWCWPIWYVEHRGLGRLTARRDHVLVALAGPAAHAVLSVLAGLVALSLPTSGAATVAASCSQVLAMAALVNLNPVVPTDGYRALEALTGRVGFRAAAITTVTGTVLRVRRDHRPGPATLLAHWSYVALCVGWGLVMVLGLVHLLTSGATP